MKFDTIIIGGGLCGLTAGIELTRKGQKCLIVSSGQSALHFFSGSFELCSLSDNPYEAISSFDERHPYSRIGIESVRDLAAEVKPFFKEIGITLKGTKDANHWRITPLGVLKRAWLTMDEYATVPSDGVMPWKKVAVLNVDGFLDFHTSFIAAGLEENGVECSYHLFALRIKDITEEQRNAIIVEMANAGVAVNVHFVPLPMLSYFNGLGYRIEDYPNAFANYSAEISLPIYPQLTDEQVDYIVECMKRAYAKVVGE